MSEHFTFQPFPYGKRFALTFVDDTDQSTVENTEPVYDFLATHGFWGSKTVWPLKAARNSSFKRSLEHAARPHSGQTLQDPAYLAFIRRLQARGFEIALHGVAAGNSTRDEIEAGIETFRALIGATPRLNAFHQTNIENLYCGAHKLDVAPLRLLERLADRSEYEGHREGTASFWGDIARATFDYVRLPFHSIDEINTFKVNPSMPFVDPRRPYVRRWFAASDGSNSVRFVRLLAEPRVDRLAREGGVCIIYTHFAKGFARPQNGRYELDDRFVEAVRRVTARPDAWFASASTILDRLAALRAMALRYEGTQLEIRNHGPRPLHDAVLGTPTGLEVGLEGAAPLPRLGNAVVLPTVRPHGVLRLTTNRPGFQTIDPDSPVITRRERHAIEIANYRGLLRGWVRDRAFYAARQLRAAHL